MKLGMVGDINFKLKFRHHSNMAAILKFFKQHFIPNNTFKLTKILCGEHGVLDLTLWHCSGILYGSHFDFFFKFHLKYHVVLNRTFVAGIWAI